MHLISFEQLHQYLFYLMSNKLSYQQQQYIQFNFLFLLQIFSISSIQYQTTNNINKIKQKIRLINFLDINTYQIKLNIIFCKLVKRQAYYNILIFNFLIACNDANDIIKQYFASEKKMQKTISSSCYDAIVIKQENRTYRSTPFQVVFASNLIKMIQKNRLKQKAQPYKLNLYVNDKLIDTTIKIDKSGRIVFEKVYSNTNRKMSMVSDSSDMSDDDLSHKSSSKGLDTKASKTKNLQDRLEQYKNQQALSSKFWQFAWLFSQKKQQSPKPQFSIQDQDYNNPSNLTKIKQQIYEGEQHSKQPLFHLSLCGNLLKRKESKQDILKTFYDHRVQYNQFLKDPPGYMTDSNLVIKIDDSIYTWQLGIAILTCRFAYGHDLTKQQIEDLVKNKFTKTRLFSFISGSSNITKLDIAECENQPLKINQLKKIKTNQKPIIKYRKTPDSDVIKKMKLKYGKNIAKFQLDIGEGVKQVVTMKIFLWDYSQKIVISDIDGTITKSDILGQILSKWIHTGVTKLFTQIYKRHYKIIYLTARAIGQYQQTSRFLQTVQEQNVYLPQGPLMMSPDGFVRSFTRQIIYKTPDYLKTKILASLNEVFPNTKNPIYCGFGNRETDSAAYSKINISADKIFCITQKSVISRQSDKEFASSYKDILANINDFFPQYFKDNVMVDSSESDDQVEQYHAVKGNQQSGKKSKSVDGGDRRNMEGYQFDQLSDIGNMSKSRKSQHQINLEDIKALQQMKELQMKQLEQLQNRLLSGQGTADKVQIKINDPVNTITQSIVNIAEGKSPTNSTSNNQNQTLSSPVSQVVKQKVVSKQDLQKIVMKQLKEDNQVNQNQVIPNSEEEQLSKDDNKSQDSKQLNKELLESKGSKFSKTSSEEKQF